VVDSDEKIFGRSWEQIKSMQQGTYKPESINLNKKGDYGSDPLGNGKFKMVPSGDIVDLVERNKRLSKDAETPYIGKHNDVPDDQFDVTELTKGIEIESEHTDDPETAKAIAKDHLSEIPDYYSRLQAMEAGAKKTTDTDYIDFDVLMKLIKDGRIEIDSWVTISGTHGTVQVRSTATRKLSSLFVEKIPEGFKK
jgi:hypothetical protein